MRSIGNDHNSLSCLPLLCPFISSLSLFLLSCLSFSCVKGAINFFNNVAKFFACPPYLFCPPPAPFFPLICLFFLVCKMLTTTTTTLLNFMFIINENEPDHFLSFLFLILMIFFNVLIVWNFTPHNFLFDMVIFMFIVVVIIIVW